MRGNQLLVLHVPLFGVQPRRVEDNALRVGAELRWQRLLRVEPKYLVERFACEHRDGALVLRQNVPPVAAVAQTLQLHP